MTQPKDTRPTTEKQPPNHFGRVPDNLLPQLCGLTHLEGHVFLVLCILANRTDRRGPLGEVPASRSELARTMGIERKSLRRALVGIERSGLILPESSCPTNRVMVTHYLGHGDPPPESSCPTESLQLPLNTNTYEPLIGSEDVVNVVDVAAAKNSPKKEGVLRRKAPVRKRLKPWLYWDDRDRLKAREDDPRCVAFFAKWKDLLGNEEIIDDETEKAIVWLREHPERRVKIKSFERFMGKWLGKLVEEE